MNMIVTIGIMAKYISLYYTAMVYNESAASLGGSDYDQCGLEDVDGGETDQFGNQIVYDSGWT